MSGDKRKLVAVPKLPILSRAAAPTSSSLSAVPVPQTNNTSPASSAASPRPDAKKHTEEDLERVKHEYDVYAKPFVPSALRAVNQLEGYIINTEPKHKIDFTTYTASFVGKSFLPERQVDTKLASESPNVNVEWALTAATYKLYFLALWRAEMAAKDIYALYKVHLSRILTPEFEDVYSLLIPGLREDSPLVEMGDTVQLRQLWVDSVGNLMIGPSQLGNPHHRAPVMQTWTGIQYNASVYAVDRAKELVYLKVDGLVPTTLVFNVVLPLKQRVLQAQWSALSRTHKELQRASQELEGGPQESTTPARLTNGDGERPNNDWIRRMTFPVESDGVQQTKLRSLPHRRGLFDPNINYEQLQAVNSGCVNEFGVLPFLISGPPGTGKTKTLVEIALQLLQTTDVAHILICAPSDQAADTLALRLRTHLTQHQMLRLNGPQRADNEVPRELLPYCYRENDMFYLPSFRQLMAYNIVITSTRDASILVDANLTNSDLYLIEKNMQSAFHPEEHQPPRKLHWGALLMDEAAQATELDALPALSVITPPSEYPTDLEQPRFVMAGDQNQLGPRTALSGTPFSRSLFARLFDRPLYRSHPLSRSNIHPSAKPPVFKASMLPMLYPPFVNLFRNYRSHPAILSVPSSLFYNDTLIPEATLEHTLLQTSSLWQGKRWPVLYIPQYGADEIERDGGGWYNIAEAREACNIAQHLVTESHVAQQDIVIMSPFAAQVRLLRKIIRGPAYGAGSGLWDVNIGPVEAFQGLESRVVILCTTRTRARFLDMDAQRGLGVIGQRRKMNVALTRAKMALFVLGSPDVLMRDEHWCAFLAFCWRNGLVRGEPFTNDMIEKFQGCRVGVLEKALVIREESKRGRALGGAAARGDIVGEDEGDVWAAWFEAAVEEDYPDEDYEEDEDGEDGDGEEETA